MPQITNLIIENFRAVKGRIKQSLTGKDIFVGHNGSGKSTRLNVAPVVITGSNPESDNKKYDAIYDSANAREMALGLELSDGRSFERRFTGKDGKITQAIIIGTDSVGVTDGNREITEAMGQNSVIFKIADFLRLSDDKQKEFLFSLGVKEDIDAIKDKVTLEFLKSVSPDVDAILKYKFKKEYTDLSPAEKTELVDEMIGSLDDIQANTLQGYITNIITRKATGSNDYIEKVLADAKKDQNARNAMLREFKNTVKSLTAMKQDKLPITETLGEIKASLEKARQELAEVEKNIALNKQNRDIVENNESRKQRVRDLLKTAKETNIKDLKATLAEIDKTIETVTNYCNISDAQEKALQQAKSKLKTHRNLLDSLANVKTQKHCVLSTDITCETDLKSFISDLEDICDQLNQNIDNMETEYLELQEKVVAEFNNKKAWPVGDYLKYWQSRRSTIEKQIQTTESNIDSYTQQLKEIESEDLSKFAVVDDNILEKQQQGWVSEIQTLKDKETQLTRAQESVSNLLNAETSLERTKIQIELSKKLVASIKAVRNGLLEPIFEPLKTDMNALLGTINPNFSFDVYLDDDDNLVMGWPKEDGTMRKFAGLSTGEKVLFSVAYITVLIGFFNPPIKVLCVKVAEVDIRNFETLLDGLEKISDRLDNIMVEYPHPELEIKNSQFNVVKL